MSSRSLLRSAVLTYGTQLVLLPLSLFGSALQARLIGAEGRGQVSMLSTALALSTLFLGLGLAGAISFHVASGHFSARKSASRLALFGAGMVAAFVTVCFVLHTLGLGTRAFGTVPDQWKFPWLLAMFPLSVVNGWLNAWHLGRKGFGAINRTALVAGLVPVAGYSLALRMGWPPLQATLLTLSCAELVRFSLLLLFAWGARAPTAGENAPLSTLVRYSLLAYLCDSVQFLTYRADVWILQSTHGDRELGEYSLAVTLAELSMLASAALGTVLFPTVAMQSAAEALATTRRMARLSLAVTFGVSVVGFALAVPLLPLIFTQAFKGSVPLLGLLLIGVVPMGVAKVLGNYFAGRGRLTINLAAAVLGLVVCLTGDLVFIPAHGATAAACATAVAYAVFCAALVYAFRREERRLLQGATA